MEYDLGAGHKSGRTPIQFDNLGLRIVENVENVEIFLMISSSLKKYIELTSNPRIFLELRLRLFPPPLKPFECPMLPC